jgi:hypothetical protein
MPSNQERSYLVEVREVWVRTVRVRAQNPEDAMQQVDRYADTAEEIDFEYSHTLPRDRWVVEEE